MLWIKLSKIRDLSKCVISSDFDGDRNCMYEELTSPQYVYTAKAIGKSSKKACVEENQKRLPFLRSHTV